MKRILIATTFALCAIFACCRNGSCACIEDKDLDVLIKNLEQNISGQEKSVTALRSRYEELLKQKKQVLLLIEEDKQHFKEKQDKLKEQVSLRKKLSEKETEKSSLEAQLAAKKREQAGLEAQKKAKEQKAKEEQKKKELQAKEEASKKEAARKKEEMDRREEAKKKEKERLYKLERERQIELAFEKAKKLLGTRDINYLDQLIKKQRELCSTIIGLQVEITAEEKNLKQLKESRQFLANPK